MSYWYKIYFMLQNKLQQISQRNLPTGKQSFKKIDLRIFWISIIICADVDTKNRLLYAVTSRYLKLKAVDTNRCFWSDKLYIYSNPDICSLRIHLTIVCIVTRLVFFFSCHHKINKKVSEKYCKIFWVAFLG